MSQKLVEVVKIPGYAKGRQILLPAAKADLFLANGQAKLPEGGAPARSGHGAVNRMLDTGATKEPTPPLSEAASMDDEPEAGDDD